MGFASQDAITKALTNGRKQSWPFFKQAVTAESAGAWTSYFKSNGNPGAGSDPTTWAAFDNGNGSINFPDVYPQKRYLVGASVGSDANGMLMVYDRLGHCNVSTTTTLDKAVTAVLPTRYSSPTPDTDDLQAIQAWVEVTTALTTTAPIIDLESYTNEGGTSGRNGTGTVTLLPSGGSLPTAVATMFALPLQTGDKGVTAIDHIDVNTASAAGAINVILLRPLLFIPLVANQVTVFDRVPNLPRVYDDSSICMALLASATTGANIWGELVCAWDS